MLENKTHSVTAHSKIKAFTDPSAKFYISSSFSSLIKSDSHEAIHITVHRQCTL